MTFEQVLDGDDMSIGLRQEYVFFDIGNAVKIDEIKSIIAQKCDEKYGQEKWRLGYAFGTVKENSKYFPQENALIL